MIQSPVKSKHQANKNKEIKTNPVIWIENQQTTINCQGDNQNGQDEYLKKEHQIYLANKLKLREQVLRYKIEEFGDSSSDSDQQIDLKKLKTKDSSYEPIIKNIQNQSIKTKSITQSEKSVNNKKTQHANIGLGKGIEVIDCLDVFINSKKGVDIWIEQNLQFKEKKLKINEIECSYYDISKIKIYLTNSKDTSQQWMKIKINWGNANQQFTFATFKDKNYRDLPYVLYIFSRVIKEKLEIMNKNKSNAQKMKSFPEKIINNSYIYGVILKKSRMINKWTQVYASINKDGLCYSKKYNEKQKVLVRRGEIKQLWTRFQLQQGYFIIKLFENSSKIELGIPIINLDTRDGWLFHIFNLVNSKV